MTDPTAVVRAWQDVIAQLRDAAVTSQTEAAGPLFTAMQRQAELCERGLRGQMEVQQELLQRLLAPINALLDVLEQASTALRSQAQALKDASTSFERVAELLESQATLFEHATSAIRRSTTFPVLPAPPAAGSESEEAS
jgi:ABC-type transporter Mla subunit MlaD